MTKTVHACLAIVADDGGPAGSRINVIVGRRRQRYVSVQI